MIDAGNILNWTHPLNRGLRYHFLVLPGQVSGTIWRNSAASVDSWNGYPNTSTGGYLSRDYAQGQWTATSPTLGFNPTTRRGGWGELRGDGSNGGWCKLGAGRVPKDPGVNGYTLGTSMAGWCNTTTSSDSAYCYILGWATGAGTHLQCIGRHGANVGYFCWGADVEVSYFGGKENTWHHIATTYSGDSTHVQSVYADGVLVGTGSNLLNILLVDTAVGVGSWWDGASQWKGACDDLRLYDRCLSAQDVAWLYYESQRPFTPLYNYLGDLTDLQASQSVAVERRTLSQFGARVGSRQPRITA
jgi:Concanavalin A-like lectin/glucanases superfamily